MSSWGRVEMGRVSPESVFMSSMVPPMILSSTFVKTISQLANGVMSISSDAITEGFNGVELGLEYRTRALIAGNTFIERRARFLKGRNESRGVIAAGVTLETLRAERCGLTPPNAGSSLNASNRFIPVGT